MAKIYDFAAIKAAVSCNRYLADCGYEVKSGRCAAAWRGGDNPSSVHVDGDKWFDHAIGKGGSVIDLCAEIETDGDVHRASQILGERYNIDPIATTKKMTKTRSQILTEQGYKKTATYDYVDENNELKYQVVRFEKEGERKEFIHRSASGEERLSAGTLKLLYNLPAVMKSDKVYVVEGEKDVETLRGLGLVGTTNSGGAANWSSDFAKYFDGKDVVIVVDNDEPGEKHALMVEIALKGHARTINVIKPSKEPHGDITDWIQNEGGTLDKLRELEGVAVVKDRKLPSAAKVAKELNKEPLSNYTEIKDDGKKRTIKVPKSIGEIITEIHNRFLGFPAKIGGALFDYDRTRQRICMLPNKDALFAWMQMTSKHCVRWCSMGSDEAPMVSQGQLYEGLIAAAKQYSMVISVPTFPVRDDVLYVHDVLPPPDPLHCHFWEMIDRFCPASNAYRLLIAALFIAPIYYEPTVPRPMWIVDTVDAQASGKTTLVKMLAWLYNDDMFAVDENELKNGIEKLMRSLLSATARSKRVVLFDNVTGTLKGKNLALLCTMPTLSGLAPYGRGVETRPNDLTYVATVNGAVVDTDIATRSYTVKIRKPDAYSSTWERDTHKFIGDNRLQILSDIIHMIQTSTVKAHREDSRFDAFDSIVLNAVCANDAELEMIDTTLRGDAMSANEDVEIASEVEQVFRDAVFEDSDLNEDYPVYIKANDMNALLNMHSGRLQNLSLFRFKKLVKQRAIPMFLNIFQLPGRPRGFLYGKFEPNKKYAVQILEATSIGRFRLGETQEYTNRTGNSHLIDRTASIPED